MLKSLLSNSRRRQFFNLLIFYGVSCWFWTFSRSTLSPYFLQSGVQISQMILGSLICYLAPILLLIIFKKINNKVWWAWSIILSFVAILVVIKVSHVWQYYLFSFLIGVPTALFSVPYNIAHFKLTPSHRNSFSSGIMFSIYPLISLVAPLAAGLLAQLNYIYIWSFSLLFFLVSLFLVRLQTPLHFNLNLKRDLRYLKPTRLIIFLEGVWEILIFGIIPIYTLYFITTPLAYGGFLSYLALMAVLANLLLGHLSDKLKDRLVFLYPITIIIALATFSFPYILKSLTLWLIITGVVQFLCPLFWNFSTSWFVDLKPEIERSMPAREFLLNLGRSAGLILVAVNFLWQSPPTLIFYFLGGVMLLYPAVLLYNTRHGAKS